MFEVCIRIRKSCFSEKLVQDAIASGNTEALLALCGVTTSQHQQSDFQPIQFQDDDPLGEQCLKSYEVDFRAIKRKERSLQNKNLLSQIIG